MLRYSLFFVFLFTYTSNAQYLWHEDDTNTHKIEHELTPSGSTSGFYFPNVTNPDTSGINTNATVTRFHRNSAQSGFLNFELFNPITNFSNYEITLKVYIDKLSDDIIPTENKIRIYLGSSEGGEEILKQVRVSAGQEWQEFTFNLTTNTASQDILDNGGYDIMRVGFAIGGVEDGGTDYYIDQIYGSTDQTVLVTDQPAAWMAGSWGITFPIFGGERLDSEIANKNHDAVSGAKEVIAELPNTGHVITNLSYFAHSHYFTFRENTNVDVTNEIHSSLIPSIENEQVAYDAFDEFKNAGIPIILYISTNYLDRASDEVQIAWQNYYTNNFGGDEYLAYRDLIQGFIPAIKDYADGYWLDTTAELDDDGNLEDFVAMLREADPGAIITAQPSGVYFQEEGGNLLVSSDGLDDTDDRDYRIISFEGANALQDYTSGHVTPLGNGAPPNSWAYEEFTLEAMSANPWSKFKRKQMLRHGWFPMREQWHSPTANPVFGTEDAYRFARIITDANAAVTFATTTQRGFMPTTEMVIMKELHDRISAVNPPDFEPYIRPDGALLVTEELTLLSSPSKSFDDSEINIYPNPAINNINISVVSKDIYNIIITSITGERILEKTLNDDQLDIQLNVSNLSSGVYFLSLSNSSKSTTQKIIITQ